MTQEKRVIVINVVKQSGCGSHYTPVTVFSFIFASLYIGHFQHFQIIIMTFIAVEGANFTNNDLLYNGPLF